MLDYLTSKMVWIVAAVVLTASVVSVFNWQRRAAEELVLDERAESIAELVNSLCSTQGSIKVSASLNESEEAIFSYESTVNGKPYELNFSLNGLMLTQEEKVVRKDFVSGVYLFDPYFIDDKAVLDSIGHQRSHLSVDGKFFIESKEFSGAYHVFIYPETPDDIREYTSQIGTTISENITWEIDRSLNTSALNSTTNLTLDRDSVFLNDMFYFSGEYLLPYPITPVYLYAPGNFSYTRQELNESDDILYAQAGSTIVLERRLISIENQYSVGYFLYSVTIQ